MRLRSNAKHPVTYTLRAPQPRAKRAPRRDHRTDDCSARAVRVWSSRAPFFALFGTGAGAAMGATHDVKNSNTSKNGAATELFQLITSLCVEPTTEKPFFNYHQSAVSWRASCRIPNIRRCGAFGYPTATSPIWPQNDP